MKRRHIFQMGVLSLFGMGVLLSMVAFDPPGLHRKQELLSLSVILRGADSASWPARQGMEQAAVDLGAELRFLALDRPNHAGEQSSLLAREAEGGADGIILVPADTEALSGDVRRAAAETTVVTIESDMSASGAVACISADNAALGEALGRAAINGVPLGGTVLLLDSGPGSSGMAQRLSQAARILEENGRRAEALGIPDAHDLGEFLSERYRTDPPDAVVAFDSETLESAARLAREFEKPPLLYGMGGTNVVVSGLERGEIMAIASQNEFAAGYLAVEAAAQAARDAPQQAVEPLPFLISRQENMYDSNHEKLLFPVTR